MSLPAPARRPTLLFLVTEDWYFVSHRLPLAAAAVAAGYRVVVATRVQDHADAIRETGAELLPLGWRRSGNTPLSQLRALAEVIGVYRELEPDLTHHVALKPVVFGTIAAWRCGVAARINAAAGLGFVFSSTGWRAKLLRPILALALRLMLRGSHQRVIVQNSDDRDTLVARRLATASQVRLIRGAGVNPALYAGRPAASEGPPLVVLVARLLWDKGVGDFAAAAKLLHDRGIVARFVLVGEPDRDNPGAVPESQLRQWQDAGTVEWWGRRDDVPAILGQSAIFCLPTRYGEGIPKSLLEAGAAGVAIVASDAPGCREVIHDGENGVLVPPGDVAALTDALARLLADPPLRRRLRGAAA
ncbi:MAG: glycosyltransferase family 4 protein, partial [Gemmatimonadota bacterium]